jgi:hypothetical protein
MRPYLVSYQFVVIRSKVGGAIGKHGNRRATTYEDVRAPPWKQA